MGKAPFPSTPYDAELENRNKLTPEEYWKQADEFDPDRYDPDELVSPGRRPAEPPISHMEKLDNQ